MLRILLPWLALLAATPVWAEDTPANTTMLGAGVWSRPAYNGADSNVLAPIPVVRHYGKRWFARTTFGMLEGGARAVLADGLILGGQLAYEGGRASSESAFLADHNISTLNPSLSWGVHAELEKKLGIMPIIALLRYRQDIESGRGAQADLRLTAGIYGNHGVNAGLFVQSTWADQKAANYYYGISAQQATLSALPAFDAANGVMFNAYGLLWSYDLTPQWILLGSFELRKTGGALEGSPLILQNTNSYTNIGLAYNF